MIFIKYMFYSCEKLLKIKLLGIDNTLHLKYTKKLIQRRRKLDIERKHNLRNN